MFLLSFMYMYIVSKKSADNADTLIYKGVCCRQNDRQKTDNPVWYFRTFK